MAVGVAGGVGELVRVAVGVVVGERVAVGVGATNHTLTLDRFPP